MKRKLQKNAMFKQKKMYLKKQANRKTQTKFTHTNTR